MDQNVQLSDLSVSHNFFAEVTRAKVAARKTAAAVTKPAPKSVYTSDSDGLMSCLLLSSKVSPQLQAIMTACQQHLIDLAGLCSAYVRHQADVQKNPNLVYDTLLWQQVYNHLPLMGPSKFESKSYSTHTRGVEIATGFLTAIVEGVLTEGASLAAFGTFLGSLGSSIRAGTSSGHKEYHVGVIAILLEEIKVGSTYDISPKLKGYFIDFNQTQSSWTGACASGQSFDLNFSYRAATSVFNYKALDNPDIKKQFDALITGSQIDDVKNSQNFFNGQT